MSAAPQPATILIAGGGIVGLALAMSIKKQLGIVPEIYEKTSTFATEAGAALGMYPNGLRVIRDISPELLQAVRLAGYPYKYRRWERHDGVEIMKAEESCLSAGENELDSIGIRRSTLQKVLYKFATEQGIVVHFGKSLVSAEERSQDDLIEVKFGDGTSRLTQVLFGADGALGKARSIVAGEDEPGLAYTGTTCLMGLAKVPCNGIYFPSSDTDDFHAVFFPTAEDETCFQFHVPVAEEESNTLNWGNLSDQVGREECSKIAAELRSNGWHEKFVLPLDKCIQAVRVGFALLEPRLKSWVRGRIVLVGDSAHPPVPYVGQGAQQGLEDAGVAVGLLKAFCMGSDGKFDSANFEKAMEVYQDIRIKRSSQILDISKRLGKMQADRSGKGYRSENRDDALRGEVLMYGTLSRLAPGADHDYKEDLIRATEKRDLPVITTEAALSALEELLAGGYQPNSNSKAAEEHAVKVNNDMYALPAERVTELAEWIFETMKRLLQEVVARRNADAKMSYKRMKASSPPPDEEVLDHHGQTIVEEVREVIEIPAVENDNEDLEVDPGSIVLSWDVLDQLKDYIEYVASLYNNNPFHNFEHAANVACNVAKLLTSMSTRKGSTLSIKDQAYGITSDPITQFACIFAALLHDADHEGVPNTQLAKEHPAMTEFYKGKALAEQHSVDIAWNQLMLPEYRGLRATIYSDEAEMKRFRQLVVNITIATEICDKDLKVLRNARVEKALAEPDTPENICRKATIGVEYLIQVSDIAHTMQPWQVYMQWNRRLYHEMFKAFKEGRADKDPTEFWFKGEIGFFDFYIIPLAKKLQDFEVFGEASDEFLQNAEENRKTWLVEGEKVVEEYVEEVKDQWTSSE